MLRTSSGKLNLVGGAVMSEEENKDEKTNQSMDRIVDSGSVITGDGKHLIQCMTIIGQIEGHTVLPSQNKTTKYEHVIPQLVAIEEDVRIATVLCAKAAFVTIVTSANMISAFLGGSESFALFSLCSLSSVRSASDIME